MTDWTKEARLLEKQMLLDGVKNKWDRLNVALLLEPRVKDYDTARKEAEQLNKDLWQ